MSGRQRITPTGRLKARLPKTTTRPKSLKRWVLDAADHIIEGGDLPGDHLVRMLMRDLKRYVDPVGERRFVHWIKVEAERAEANIKRAELKAAIAENRRKGVKRPVEVANVALAKRWGHHSGKAFRKSIHPSRLSRALPPREPRG
jgi:hypothetical protein